MALAASFPAAGRTRPVVPAAARYRRASTVRLTRRGRAVAVAVSVLFLLVAIVASGQLTAGASSAAPVRPATTVVVVQEGESLWQIARRVAPHDDPRAIVTRVREINHLGTEPVVPGQSVLVPVSA